MTAEMLCALHRKERSGDLKRGGADAAFERFLSHTAAGRIVTVPYGSDVLTEARNLTQLAFHRPRPLMVRSLDVIHLATAMAVQVRTFVATDARLRELAALASLKVLP